MTIYTEFFLACDLMDDAPQQVIDTLKYLTRNEDYPFDNPPDHPFFSSDTDIPVYQYWRNFFKFHWNGPDDLDHFPGTGVVDFHSTSQSSGYEPGFYTITIRYEYELGEEEIFSFLDWLAPYVDSSTHGGFAGYFRQTNVSQEYPTLIYLREEEVFLVEVSRRKVEKWNSSIRETEELKDFFWF